MVQNGIFWQKKKGWFKVRSVATFPVIFYRSFSDALYRTNNEVNILPHICAQSCHAFSVGGWSHCKVKVIDRNILNIAAGTLVYKRTDRVLIKESTWLSVLFLLNYTLWRKDKKMFQLFSFTSRPMLCRVPSASDTSAQGVLWHLYLRRTRLVKVMFRQQNYCVRFRKKHQNKVWKCVHIVWPTKLSKRNVLKGSDNDWTLTKEKGKTSEACCR